MSSINLAGFRCRTHQRVGSTINLRLVAIAANGMHYEMIFTQQPGNTPKMTVWKSSRLGLAPGMYCEECIRQGSINDGLLEHDFDYIKEQIGDIKPFILVDSKNVDARMADFERFTLNQPQNSKTLQSFLFMRDMANEAVDPKAANALLGETMKKMRESMTTQDAWTLGKISGKINSLQYQISAISNGPFANFGSSKSQVADLMVQLENAKTEYQEFKQQQANATLAKFAPDNPSPAPTPKYGSGVTPELQAKLEPIFQKFGSIFQNGMLHEQKFGQPLVFRVDYESLGVGGNLAQVDAQFYGNGNSIKVITINSDTIDRATLESSVFHEMAHILQFNQDYNVMGPHWDYVKKRVNGQPVMLDQNEVLATAIEQFVIDPVGLMHRDPDLFAHVAAFVSGKAATYSKNRYAPIRPASGSTYTPGTPGATPGTWSNTKRT
jgi:hypothetical protein